MKNQTELLEQLLLLTFDQNETFTKRDVDAVAVPVFTRKYPNNNTVTYTLALQLQKLRDQGLLTFVDNKGTYCFTH